MKTVFVIELEAPLRTGDELEFQLRLERLLEGYLGLLGEVLGEPVTHTLRPVRAEKPDWLKGVFVLKCTGLQKGMYVTAGVMPHYREFARHFNEEEADTFIENMTGNGWEFEKEEVS